MSHVLLTDRACGGGEGDGREECPVVVQSNPLQSNPIQSMQSNPVQSNPIQSSIVQSSPDVAALSWVRPAKVAALSWVGLPMNHVVCGLWSHESYILCGMWSATFPFSKDTDIVGSPRQYIGCGHRAHLQRRNLMSEVYIKTRQRVRAAEGHKPTTYYLRRRPMAGAGRN